MLKRELKLSAKYNEDGALPELVGRDLERNLDNVDKKLETEELPVEDEIEEVSAEDDMEIEDDAEEIPDHLEVDMEEPEEEFKDINEKVVVYMYRGFSELGDNVRLFVEDEDNEERDPELVKILGEFMENFPEVMETVKDLAKKYVTSVELFDPEAEEEVVEDPTSDEDENELEIEAEELETLESYIKENNLDHSIFESECEIYARYSTSEEAARLESELSSFKSAEVFKHEDIGEIHAFIRVR